MTMKNLGALYKRQGRLEAALVLENTALQHGPWQTVRHVICFYAHFAVHLLQCMI